MSSLRDSQAKYTEYFPTTSQEPRELVGKFFWTVFHTIAVTADLTKKEERDAVLKLFDVYKTLFPCADCRKNFRAKMDAHPPQMYMDSNENLFFLTYLYHDIVNQGNGKKSPNYFAIKREYFTKLGKKGSCSKCS